MEAEFATAKKLLLSILAKRGEEMTEKAMEELIQWARNRGFLWAPSLLFSPEEWREVGDKLLERTISSSGKDSKEALGHGVAWSAIINTLREMEAESKVAAAVMQTLGVIPLTAPPPVVVAPNSTNCIGALFQLGSGGEIKGMVGKTCSNIQELVKQAQLEAGIKPVESSTNHIGALFRLGSGRAIKGMVGKTCSNIPQLVKQAQLEAPGEMIKEDLPPPPPATQLQEVVEAPQVPNEMEAGEPVCHPKLYPPLLSALETVPLPEDESEGEQQAPAAEHIQKEPAAPPLLIVSKKREDQHEGSSRKDTNSWSNILQQLLPPDTRGSLGIDLAAAVDVTLLDSSVRKIPTSITGPIYKEKDSALGALLLGRSSASLAGLIVLPGVVDADYTGEIMICAYMLTPPLTITKGTQIAQLIMYQKCQVDNDIFQHVPRRGAKGFGSTGDTVVSLVQKMQQRPLQIQLRCKLHQCSIRAMADTRADVTLISERAWPRNWPLMPTVNAVQGVGGRSMPKQSVETIQLLLPEGQTITLRPYVMNLPGDLEGLFGRDVLAQMELFLRFQSQVVDLFNNGHCPTAAHPTDSMENRYSCVGGAVATN
ncbi:hypothetical protein TURU_134546 [Turdus rufiventris]|nr:hypothetical protein TURU_134546 [Turdus rufiventris]